MGPYRWTFWHPAVPESSALKPIDKSERFYSQKRERKTEFVNIASESRGRLSKQVYKCLGKFTSVLTSLQVERTIKGHVIGRFDSESVYTKK
jgi:hypothetical protein